MNIAISWKQLKVTFILTGSRDVRKVFFYYLTMSEYSMSVFNHKVNKA